MFGLPSSTDFGKKIPKQAFYEKGDVSSAVKRLFINCVENIIWQNKLSPSTERQSGTLAVSKGRDVLEIEVIEIELRDEIKKLEDFLTVMDKASPHHAVFITTLNGMSQIWIGFKNIQIFENVKKFTVSAPVYFHSDWKESSLVQLKLQGLTIDEIYENLIRSLEPKLFSKRPDESLKDCVLRYTKFKSLDEERTNLRKKMSKEIQTNRKVDIKEQIKQLNSQIEELEK